MSCHEGRLKGKGILGKKSNMHIPESEIRKANFTVLQNSSLVAPYMDEHMNIVRSENPRSLRLGLLGITLISLLFGLEQSRWLTARLQSNFNGWQGDINDNHAVPRVRD